MIIIISQKDINMDPDNFLKHSEAFRKLIVNIKKEFVSMGEKEDTARIMALGTFLTNSIFIYQMIFPNADKECFMDDISKLYDAIAIRPNSEDK